MIYINNLITGSMGVGSSTPSGNSETRFTLQGGTVETYGITGTLDQQWMINSGYYELGGGWLKTITQADIGNTVTSIGDHAFEMCSDLTGVTIPDSVTSIGYWAFAACSKLTNVTIPNSVTNVGFAAFMGCIGLTSVTIPNSVTSIGESAFGSCSGLTSITVPDSVTSIGDGAFSRCRSLTNVTIIATGKPGASAETVKQAMIDAGVSSSGITWNMIG